MHVCVCVCLAFALPSHPRQKKIVSHPSAASSMENRGKNEWGFLVVLAVGVFAYYLSTLKPSPDPEKRRKDVLRRLHDGASPRMLLKGGFSPAELLNAGVPREALRSVYPVSSSMLPSRTPRREARRRSPSTPGFSYAYEPLMLATDTMRNVSEALNDGLRSRSMSTSVSDVREVTHGHMARSTTVLSTRSYSQKAENLPTSSRRSSVRLAARMRLSPAQHEFYDCNSIERSSATRTPVGTVRVRVAALSAAITCGYSGESAVYHHPLEVLRFLHEDGSRLSIMAEDCSALKSGEVLTTEVYVKRSLARARAAADSAKTYFKVKLHTAARKIATTVMESYVNIYAGPSPVILAGFYLVKDNTAYTIQLQTHTDAYEERLADLLYAAQSARLQGAEETAGSWSRGGRGRNEYHVEAEGVDRVYVVETPVDVVVRGPTVPHAARSELILTPCSSGGDTGAPWHATIAVCPNAAREHAESGERRHNVIQLLQDAHVSIELIVYTADSAAAGTTSSPPPLPPPLAAVMAREATTADRQLSSSVYRSAELTMALPPPEHFHTVVCEHPYESSMTLFITSVTSAELFEMELRRVSHMNEDSLEQLFSYVETLFLTPARPRRSMNAAGQACFSVEGIAVSPAKTTLWVYGVQLREECWLIFRWLCTASAVESPELEQYRRELVKSIVCRSD
ncbi:conserved hypothetical protein [Leishmania major strain Friedlin]|uniref:Uncharacterized protein n=1 Tax=Leishmania major TaxID=5664 RepID=Q4Q0A7_LEIMA|nr:conserved hypothetical protein [Leishmania major strain Friedlin]CAG9584212.1 hypothetical_protein_-_conserved [Leishmania major strain Friedlin]CAJ09628.1 conserved hypothetical protein [Leishmania major strain Friedlin]|eukprot:XP_001687241.1 conserved hypothetical protein [Leishmania major strain Friedlin]